MFHAIFGRRNSDVAPQSPLQLQRERQVATIRSWCPNVAEVQPDEEYQINFVAGNIPLTLVIRLPSSFPHESPELKVTPLVKHPLLDENQHITGVPALTAFSMHADLGRIISGIVNEFQNHPPTLCTPAGSLKDAAPFPLPSATRNSSVAPKQMATLPPFLGHSAKLSSQFLQLGQLSTEQLEELAKDDSKLSAFVEQLPEVLRTSEIKQQMICQNDELAKKNLALKPIMEQRKSDLLAKLDEVNRLKQEFEHSSQTFDLHTSAYHPSTLQDNLRVATSSAEEESEGVAEEFLDGKINTDTFLSRFMEKRTLAHIRRAKEEKLHMQLQQLQWSGF